MTASNGLRNLTGRNISGRKIGHGDLAMFRRIRALRFISSKLRGVPVTGSFTVSGPLKNKDKAGGMPNCVGLM